MNLTERITSLKLGLDEISEPDFALEVFRGQNIGLELTNLLEDLGYSKVDKPTSSYAKQAYIRSHENGKTDVVVLENLARVHLPRTGNERTYGCTYLAFDEMKDADEFLHAYESIKNIETPKGSMMLGLLAGLVGGGAGMLLGPIGSAIVIPTAGLGLPLLVYKITEKRAEGKQRRFSNAFHEQYKPMMTTGKDAIVNALYQK